MTRHEQEQDHYLVLGVEVDASQEGIREAFRELARRHHPDRAGHESTREFQVIAAAYEVLGDPGSRAAYDDRRRRRELFAHGAPVFEPEDALLAALAMLRDLGLAAGAARGARFTHVTFGRSMGPRLLKQPGDPVEVSLTEKQAKRGGVVTASLPILDPCGWCGGFGRSFFGSCQGCQGRGGVPRELEVRVRVPRHVKDGDELEMSLPGLGPVRLRVRVA